MVSWPGLSYLNDININKSICEKLPQYIVNDWIKVVDWAMYEGDQITGSGNFPPFSTFCEFIKKKARLAANPLVKNPDMNFGYKQKEPETRGKKKIHVNKVVAEEKRSEERKYSPKKEKRPQFCPLCNLEKREKVEHGLTDCKKFKDLSLEERKNFVYKNRVCRSCLLVGHVGLYCRNRATCGVCEKKHPTLLHDESFNKDPEGSLAATSVASHKIASENITFQNQSLILPVTLSTSSNDINVKVYAILDSQSDVSFITSNVYSRLNVKGEKTKLRITTILGEESVESTRVKGIYISGAEDQRILLPPLYTSSLSKDSANIPDKEVARRYKHLQPIVSKINSKDSEREIGILIGLNCSKLLRPLKVILGGSEDSYAVETMLGWAIVGYIYYQSSK